VDQYPDPISLEMLDPDPYPDPDSMKQDPQHWFYARSRNIPYYSGGTGLQAVIKNLLVNFVQAAGNEDLFEDLFVHLILAAAVLLCS
jgi:hypothetical protein